jgi:ribosome-binding factor A
VQGNRLERIGHLIQKELGQLLLNGVKDPRIGFVTITHVSVAPDIRSAKVFYSVIGDKKIRKESQIGLEKAAGFLQREISRTIELRYTPVLNFEFDDTLDRRMEIEKVIKTLDDEKKQSGE